MIGPFDVVHLLGYVRGIIRVHAGQKKVSRDNGAPGGV